jgi:hypothetical protein
MRKRKETIFYSQAKGRRHSILHEIAGHLNERKLLMGGVGSGQKVHQIRLAE